MNLAAVVDWSSVIVLVLYLTMLADIGLEAWRRNGLPHRLKSWTDWLVVAFIASEATRAGYRVWIRLEEHQGRVDPILLGIDTSTIVMLMVLWIVTIILRIKLKQEENNGTN